MVGRERLPASASPAGKDYLLVRFPSAVGPGPARLTIDYRGKARRHDGDGIYQVEEAGAHYLFTQFEATDARQAFPCFDEPSYKVPWRLSIRTRADQVALANTPAVEEIDGQRSGQPGWKTVRFAADPARCPATWWRSPSARSSSSTPARAAAACRCGSWCRAAAPPRSPTRSR